MMMMKMITRANDNEDDEGDDASMQVHAVHAAQVGRDPIIAELEDTN